MPVRTWDALRQSASSALAPKRPQHPSPAKPAAKKKRKSKAQRVLAAETSRFTATHRTKAGGAAHGKRPLARLVPGLTVGSQEGENSCGTTALAAVMTYFGKPRSFHQIDEKIRPLGLFTAPDKIVEYANANGMRASMKIGASLPELTKLIDAGAPPMVLVDLGTEAGSSLAGRISGSHYMVATGYLNDAKGKLEGIRLTDENGDSWLKVETFEKIWSKVKVVGIDTGIDRAIISAVPNDGRILHGTDKKHRRANALSLPSTVGDAGVNAKVFNGIGDAMAEAGLFARRAASEVKTDVQVAAKKLSDLF